MHFQNKINCPIGYTGRRENKMKCIDCPYYWAETGKYGEPIELPHCHYQYEDGYAPCELEEYETPDVDD